MRIFSAIPRHRPHGTRKPRPARRAQAGFTLMELLVVLAILGLLAAFAAPRVIQYLSAAKSDVAAVQIDNLAAALDLFRLEVGRYPTSDEGLEALMTQPDAAPEWRGPYLDKRDGLTDPWGRPYAYRQPGEHGGDYDLYTLGADGREGGEDENADIVNW